MAGRNRAAASKKSVQGENALRAKRRSKPKTGASGSNEVGSQKNSELCAVFGKCGGCDYLDITYANQLVQKQSEIESLFAPFLFPGVLQSIKGMETPFHYRNKVITPYVYGGKLSTGKRQILTGMYEAGTHRVLQTDECLLENVVAQRAIRAIKHIMSKYDIQPYDEDKGTGFIRHAVVRAGHESGEVLVTIVTNGSEFPHSKSFCKKLIEKVPEITTVVQNVNTRKTNVILGDEERVLFGPGFILDTLCGLSFRISPHSFYQVNSVQTEVLYKSAMELAKPECGGVFVDGYCGTGTIGLVAASMGASRVIGVDSVSSAIRDARMNAKHNGITNAEFVCEDATEFLQRVAAEGGLDGDLTILMDPPRAGSTDGFLRACAALSPKRIVYISCNPKTQLRDVERLVELGFRVDSICPIDMFPNTKHIENIVALVSRT